MPLRRTKRSDGRPRPRWKDGSHELVENKNANKSQLNGIALEANRPTELLVATSPLFRRSHEPPVSTRDRLARTGADVRIEESGTNGEVRLAIRPYGRKNRSDFRQVRLPLTENTEPRETFQPAAGKALRRSGRTAHANPRGQVGPALSLLRPNGAGRTKASDI